ncbi:hypothetical protein ACRRTK_024915 [Alexandromys fortis]
MSCRMSGSFFCEAGTLKDHSVFWKVLRSLFRGSCLSSFYSIPSSSPAGSYDHHTSNCHGLNTAKRIPEGSCVGSDGP